jgi:branched-subunit amino acid aminotransferase/4-amino-4-deoxychorismate lyase
MPSEEFIRTSIKDCLDSSHFLSGRLRICIGNGIFHISHNEYVESQQPARVNFYSETVIGRPHKTFPYDDRYAILSAAHDEGFDDSILFNARNEVTETSVANLILRINNEWVTAPLGSGILPGVMRALAIEECGVTVRPIHISEISDVSAAFMVASLRIATPISHIGDMKIEIGEPSRSLENQLRALAQPDSVG